MTSSDALKNSPFILLAVSPQDTEIVFTPNDEYAKSYSSDGKTAQVNVVKIPKGAIGFVSAGSYQLAEKVAHMPMVSPTEVYYCSTTPYRVSSSLILYCVELVSFWNEKLRGQNEKFKSLSR